MSEIVEFRLVIDGKVVSPEKIKLFNTGDELGLIFRPDLNSGGPRKLVKPISDKTPKIIRKGFLS